jgi:hypothetical protein
VGVFQILIAIKTVMELTRFYLNLTLGVVDSTTPVLLVRLEIGAVISTILF